MSAETMLLDRLLDRVVREVEHRVFHENEGKEARDELASERAISAQLRQQVENLQTRSTNLERDLVVYRTRAASSGKDERHMIDALDSLRAAASTYLAQAQLRGKSARGRALQVEYGAVLQSALRDADRASSAYIPF